MEYWLGTKISIPVSSLSALALDLISAPASQTYTEHIFSISSDVAAGKRNHSLLRHRWSAECFEVESKYLYELL